MIALEEIFIPRMTSLSANGTAINGDGSGYEFYGAGEGLECRIIQTSEYWSIQKDDVYRFVEERCGGIILKLVKP